MRLDKVISADQMCVHVVKTALNLVLGEGVPSRLKAWCIHSYYLEGLMTERTKR